MKRTLLRTLAAVSLMTCGSAVQVYAEESARTLEEITVVARRTTESLQDVPLSITAVDEQTLSDLQIDSFEDFKNFVPNLNVQTQFGQPSTPQIYMRGVATGLLSFTVDAGVQSYVDGVYIGRAVGSAFTQPDLAQVEVVRGPQGTLFGRNSIGGAINFITKSPSDEFSVRADVTTGNYDLLRYRLTLETGDLGGFAARVTFLHNERDGYVDNNGPKRTWTAPEPFGAITSADSYGLVDEDAVFASVRISAIDNVTIDYRFDWNDRSASQLAVQYLGNETGDFGELLRGGSLANGGTAPIGTDRLSSVPLSYSSEGDTEVSGHSLTIEVDISDAVTLKSTTAYRSMEQFSGGNDIDGGDYFNPFLFSADPFCAICSIALRDQDQLTQEGQLQISLDKSEWIIGAYYFNEDGDVNNPTFATRLFPGFDTGPIGPATLSLFGLPDYFLGEFIDMENTSKAVFAHVNFALTDQLDLAVGIRHTEDEREVTDHFLSADFDEDFNHTDYDASLTYAMNDAVTIYGRFSTGYLTGGILRGGTFDEETIDSFELGLKSTFADGRARVNIAAYQADRDDVQIATFGAAGLSVTNGSDADQKGIELETSYMPLDGLTLALAYGVNDTDFDLAPGDPAYQQSSPEKNIVFSAVYEGVTLGNGAEFSARLDAGWTDTYSGFSAGLANTVLEDALEQGGDVDVGLRLTVSNISLGSDSSLRISAWGKNLTDNDKPEFVRNLFGFVGGNFQIPRTYGVDLSVTF